MFFTEGGLIINSVINYPTVLEHKLIDFNFKISALTSGQIFTISIYPPLSPHSPIIPLLVLWTENNSP